MTAKRVDANQSEIVAALRKFGASVWDTHEIGHGPDIIVGWSGKVFCMEIKTEEGTLTPSEKKFRESWRGNYYVIRSIEDALQVLCDAVEE